MNHQRKQDQQPDDSAVTVFANQLQDVCPEEHVKQMERSVKGGRNNPCAQRVMTKHVSRPDHEAAQSRKYGGDESKREVEQCGRAQLFHVKHI